MSYKLTSNFEKELNKFFEWAGNNYIIENDLNETLNWNKNVLLDYEETPRKKLDGFVKNVFKMYIIKDINTNEMVDTFTEIVDNFRNKKEAVKENKKELRKTKKTNNDTFIELDNNELDKYKLSEQYDFNDTQPYDASEYDNLYFNNSLDTSNTWWLYSLSCTTD